MQGTLSPGRVSDFQPLYGALAEPHCFFSKQGLCLRGSAKDQKLPNLLLSKFLPQTLSGRKTVDRAKRGRESERGIEHFQI